jgi:Protein of unknown function (DUF3040)
MALSPEEHRILEQMEAALAAEDPALERTLVQPGDRRGFRRRLALAVAGVLAGLVLLVLGISTTPVVGALGYAVMIAASVVGAHRWWRPRSAPDAGRRPGPATRPRASGIV